jgi:hypothetical protein
MKLTIFFRRIVTLFMASIGLLLAACSSLNASPTVTPASQPSPSPTSTIVWFPPTNTPTALPTRAATPTENYLPGVGTLVFSDSFNLPELWNTAVSDQASAVITRNRLILSINEPGPLIIKSLRSGPLLGDFYAEALAEISLCSAKDQYGMLFRAASVQDYYRLIVNCEGQTRLERVRAGVNYPLSEWLTSSDVPLGAPAQVKLGIWVAGREMRVFLNDHLHFVQSDPVFSSGTVGFFVYASGQSPLTISFSDLSVYSVNYIFPTPTPILITPVPPTPTPIL